ncbi:MAG: hypothetical protein ACRCXZ_04405 [Patescibacteria group bacterium]
MTKILSRITDNDKKNIFFVIRLLIAISATISLTWTIFYLIIRKNIQIGCQIFYSSFIGGLIGELIGIIICYLVGWMYLKLTNRKSLLGDDLMTLGVIRLSIIIWEAIIFLIICAFVGAIWVVRS